MSGATVTPGAPSPNASVTPDAGTQTSPSPAPASDSFDDMSDDEAIRTLLEFDPFDKKTKGADAPVQPADATPAGTPADQAPPKVEAPPVSQPAAGGNDIAQAAQALREAATAMRATPAQAPQGQQQQPPDEPNFNFNVPQPIFEALNSQDPQQRLLGTQALVSGTVRAAHQLVMKELEKVVRAVPQYVERQLAQRKTVDDIKGDFNRAHPALGNPHLAPLVASVMQEVFAERQRMGQSVNWSPELRDAIAERAYSIIPGLKAQPAGQTPAPAAPPSPIFTNGSRPAPARLPDQAEDVMQTFFTGRG